MDASARYWARQRGHAGDGRRLLVAVSNDHEGKCIRRSPAGGPLAEDLAVALDEKRPGRVEEYVARAWQAIVRALDPGGPPQHRFTTYIVLIVWSF